MDLCRFFFDNLTTSETFETDNEAEAWAKFNACPFPCELNDNGELLADKYFEYDEINDRNTLETTIYIDEPEPEYCEL